ncbi:MAG TPA: xanthine dehydrogenase family protein subunit M [Segeticoccus sp.]|uniref:FAD binding domain-containing protein n=1 Tax=Segeticoccus sp. TaxID=2706531 RepID=UPI002D7F07DC|nr:xanthine dehydrogenase family protein subunit M [Segeticoccus sp.]HET8599703.1 xanthine dehydrogenase family protein subunit M [Segeticoccus sp.]
MIPAPFEYHAPTTLEEALQLLAESDDAKVLAGGQSLLPVLKLRLAAPEVVVDLAKISQLQGIREEGDHIVVGAMTPHYVVADDPTVNQHALLLAEATRTVADPQVRHRGTLGGALVHADPAGDLLAPALSLEAELVIAGQGGATRTVPAADFFEDLFTTAVGEDEILTEVRIPKHTGWGAHYEKFTRVAQQWSIVAVAATVRSEGGTVAEARVSLTNMGSTPVRCTAVEEALVGMSADSDRLREVCAAAGEGTTPPDDTNGDAAYRRHLAGVLTGRAVRAALA